MNNSDMTPDRFLTAMKYKKLYNSIIAEIQSGRAIQVSTHTRSMIYKKAEQFKLGKTGVYVQSGRKWVCINYSSIRAVTL